MPSYADEYSAYDFAYHYPDSRTDGARLDLATGALTPLQLPGQTQSIYAVGEDRFLLMCLITDVPLPDSQEWEQYEAVCQNATAEYDWYDPATGELEKIWDQPYYGIEQPDGGNKRYSLLGMAGERLYFQNTHLLRGNSGVEVLDMQVESCAVDGTDWQTECTLTAGNAAPIPLWEGPTLRWLIDNTTSPIKIYDLTDRAWHTIGLHGIPESLTGDGKVYLMQEQWGSDGSYKMVYGLADRDDYLAGSTDWTPVTPYAETS